MFQKEISELTWQDVEAFLQEGIAESAYLDFKSEFPDNEKLAKTISAFANTHGGIIVLGVEEDNQSKSKIPIKGISERKKIEEKITNIVISHISPPLLPEIKVIQHHEEDKCIVIIRIPESSFAPHRIQNQKCTYYRTGNRNNPEELVTPNQMDWLLDKRRASVALHSFLIQQNQSRFETLLERLKFSLLNKSRNSAALSVFTGEYHEISKEEEKGPWLYLALVPVLPSEMLVSPPELISISKEIAVEDYFGTSSKFPLGLLDPRLMQDGIYFEIFTKNKFAHFTELNSYGAYFYKQRLRKIHANSGKEITRDTEIFARLDQFINSARLFYEKLNIINDLKFYFTLSDIDEFPIQIFSDPYSDGEESKTSIDNQISYEEIISAKALPSKHIEIIFRVIEKIGWGLDWDMAIDNAKKYYARTKVRR